MNKICFLDNNESNKSDNVNHPSHYTWLKDICGVEVIYITRYLDFDCGNAVKYLLRAGHKSENGLSDDDKKFEDISKARWYCQDAMHLYNKHKYLYPKNNHLYTKISEVRCKDVTTGNWYDAVLYTDGKGVYVREKKDFEAKFQQQ